ncbi:olfactory receptor 5D13-like [Puma concolor]|uniref:Olfactory receptor 5D13-like n=1 Tax=Puma concolor TaxID=9696 RepID=A0A6P6I7C6_PUMCO|nr:olfactory receptor 5D13-like [Puma concolor]
MTMAMKKGSSGEKDFVRDKKLRKRAEIKYFLQDYLWIITVSPYCLILTFLIWILFLTFLHQLSCFVHRNQENQSAEVTFILLGFSEYPELQMPLFLVFLTIYTVTVLGNLGMIMIIQINPKLHTPMYFFLSHLSLVDFCYSTVVTPKLLENLIVEDRTISFTGCIMQFFFACIFVVTETFMLAVMAYHKAFSTCASHLIAITIFHGTILFLYCVPNSKSSWLMVKVASVFYTVVIPMLNPLIYSLRNKDVKETVKKLINTKLS